MPKKVGKARRRTTSKDVHAERQTTGVTFYHDAAERLNKKVGENTVVDEEEFVLSSVKEFISTQCYGLDYAMHLPGIPVGRVNCIRGDFMSGKSTLALHIMAEAQKMGGFAVYMDTEYAFDKKRAEAIGIETTEDKWMLIQVETVEAAVQSVRELVETAREMQDAGVDRLVCIVWDSVSATSTKAEMEAEFGESRPGLHARLLSAALRQLTPKIAKYRICLILVNQEKDRVDFFSMGKDVKTMIAERPIMFHSSVVLRPQHKMMILNSKKEPTGIRVVITVRKNKLAAPFSKTEAIINFADGLDNNASILSIAQQKNIVKKSGSWYVYEGKKFYERDFGKILVEHPEIMDELEAIQQKDLKEKTAVPDEGAYDDGDESEEEDE